MAQEVDESALDALDRAAPVIVQPKNEPAGAVELRAAMRRIAYSPTDADALADAGNAALMLGDANAALNFFTRANSLRPNNGRIVSGLAAATVRTENPFEALRLFDDAVRLGVSERTIAADRALAFDLLGNFDRAQQDYKLARSASASDDLVIRQAISMSLAGDGADADAMLVPLLQKNNPGAWRARAFMLAARGDFRESAKVTQGFMDQVSAQRMERYLRLMPDLTGAQQAAAIHLGHFPASSYVGRDSEQVRRIAALNPAAAPPKAESRLIPAGTPLGSKAVPEDTGNKSNKRDRRARDQEDIKAVVANIPDSAKLPKTDNSRLRTESARAAVEQARMAKIAAAQGVKLPPPETARPPVSVPTTVSANAISPKPLTDESRQIVADTAKAASSIATLRETQTSTLTADTSPAVQVPTADGAPITQTAVAQQAAQTAPAAISAPAAAFDLAAVVSTIQIPDDERKSSVVAVDLRKITPAQPRPTTTADAASRTAKPDPRAIAKAKPIAIVPARYWVQIATGQASALSYDYGKWVKKAPELFKKQAGWTAPWGRTSRLLVGPFADQKAAKKWEVDFKKAGGDSFGWKSEAGEEVTKLKSK